MQNKSHRKMLNNKGPNMDLWGTPNEISSQELKSEFILVLCLRWSVVLIKPLWVGFKKKQPSRYVLRKRCSENMQQIYRSKPKPKCDFNKVSLQLYWTHASAWVFSLFSEHLFLEHLWTASSDLYELDGVTFLK